jgi:hypothetical protein
MIVVLVHGARIFRMFPYLRFTEAKIFLLRANFQESSIRIRRTLLKRNYVQQESPDPFQLTLHYMLLPAFEMELVLPKQKTLYRLLLQVL